MSDSLHAAFRFLVLATGLLLAAQGAHAAGMCAQGMVWINCGRGAQCAIPPAVCCAGAICGQGMVCAHTSRGNECAVPSVVTYCGRYTCGEGMICLQTPRGPECGVAGTNDLSGGGGRPGGAMPSGSFLKNCIQPPSNKSRAQCICLFNAMLNAGFTSDEIYTASLFLAGRNDEVRARLGGGYSRFLDRVARVNDSGCY